MLRLVKTIFIFNFILFVNGLYVTVDKETGSISPINLNDYFNKPNSRFDESLYLNFVYFDSTTSQPECRVEIDAQFIASSQLFKIDQWIYIPSAFRDYPSIVISADIYDLQLFVDYATSLGVFDHPDCRTTWNKMRDLIIAPLVQAISTDKTLPGMQVARDGLTITVYCNDNLFVPCTEEEFRFITQSQ